MVNLDEYSVTTVPLTQVCKGNAIGTATGFFYKHGDRRFLVTNWHVLSGRNPYDGQPLHKSGGTPDTVTLPLHKQKLGEFLLGHRCPIEDGNGDPIWLQHPRGQDIDVAVLPLPNLPPDCVAYELPRPGEKTDMRLQVGLDCFVIGFPLGISHQQILPIWKRASIASEPQAPHDNLPVFLIDTATRSGMSGSPVILRGGSYINTSGDTVLGVLASRWVGVYSGRYVGANELEAQLGRVWHRQVVDEIITGNVRGSYQLRRTAPAP
jgi:trypsin-like peptidase